MDYVRSFGVPIPRVLAWCSNASGTPVESEYIHYYGKCPRNWAGPRLGQNNSRVKGSHGPGVGCYRQTTDAAYIGRLCKYFLSWQNSLDLCTAGDLDERFVLGPNIQRRFGKMRDGWWILIGVLVCAVSQSDFLYPNKFSGRDVLSAVRATVDRERQWIERYAVAKYPPGPFDPPLTIQQASAHFSFLDRFDKVAPYIIPPHPEFARPTLWHTDLHFGNLFVSENASPTGRLLSRVSQRYEPSWPRPTWEFNTWNDEVSYPTWKDAIVFAIFPGNCDLV